MKPGYISKEGIPVFVDRVQFDGNTYPDDRIEVYSYEDVGSKVVLARRFTGKAASVPCAVPERKES